LQLLVSVRDLGEVDAALEGGADIIDAKEPAHGALGAVTPDCLRAIDDRVPGEVPLSVALGEAPSAAAVAATIAALPLRRRRAPVYLKLGLSPGAAANNLGVLFGSAVQAAARHPARPHLIAVEYADWEAHLFSPTHVREAASAAGATGILVDTSTKDGRTLFAWWSETRLRAWIDGAHAGGLSAAVAGSLGAGELARMAGLGADVVGVRGAACAGGRSGAVQADRVRLLRAALTGESGAAANRQIWHAALRGRPHS
jgi:uncharacterized protein (UPF0264 family)